MSNENNSDSGTSDKDIKYWLKLQWFATYIHN